MNLSEHKKTAVLTLCQRHLCIMSLYMIVYMSSKFIRFISSLTIYSNKWTKQSDNMWRQEMSSQLFYSPLVLLFSLGLACCVPSSLQSPRHRAPWPLPSLWLTTTGLLLLFSMGRVHDKANGRYPPNQRSNMVRPPAAGWPCFIRNTFKVKVTVLAKHPNSRVASFTFLKI